MSEGLEIYWGNGMNGFDNGNGLNFHYIHQSNDTPITNLTTRLDEVLY